MANRLPLRRFSGEPIHPATVHFPLALFPAATLFDLLALLRSDGSIYTRGAFVLIAAAGVCALAAATTGFMQLLDVPSDSPAWRLVIWHMSVQLLAVTVLLVGWLFRLGHLDDAHAPVLAIAINAIGSALLLGGGWLGGRLVFRYGVSVEGPAPAAPAAAEAPVADPLVRQTVDVPARR